jgi:hypothetical protein
MIGLRHPRIIIVVAKLHVLPAAIALTVTAQGRILLDGPESARSRVMAAAVLGRSRGQEDCEAGGLEIVRFGVGGARAAVFKLSLPDGYAGGALNHEVKDGQGQTLHRTVRSNQLRQEGSHRAEIGFREAL